MAAGDDRSVELQSTVTAASQTSRPPSGAPSGPGSEDELPERPERPDLIEVPERPRSLVARIRLVALALLLAFVGLLLWPIPIATGLPFYAAALVTLGLASRRVARNVNRWEHRLPDRWSALLRRMVPNRGEPGGTSDPR